MMVTLVVLLLSACQPLQLTSADVPTFEEAACPFAIPPDVVEGEDVVCGYVVVPEDHANPAAQHIRLAVVVVKDNSDDHQPDPVLLLSGGPGERVVADAPMLVPFLESIYPNRDLVLFDQRGVGLSEPVLECPEFLAAQFEMLDETDNAVVAEIVHDATKACANRLADEGHNLSAYNTTQNAADVDAVRRALGYDQVNLYGGSYGSLLAQAVMRDHPENIRSVVLTSVLPLEKSLFVDASATTAQAILRLLDTCAADDACNAAYPDLQIKLFEVIDRLNAEPVPVTVTNPLDGESYDALLTGETVRANLVTFLYTTQIIPVLPQAIDDVYNGDYELMTQLSSTRLALLDLLSRGMTFSVVCTEDLIGRTPDDLLAVIASMPRQLVVGTEPETIMEHGIFGICADWPVAEADSAVKEPLVSDIPTLVLAGELDPVTPPEYGELVADYLSNGYFYTLPGVGHNIIVEECAGQLASAFLTDPSQAPDVACIADMPGLVFDLPTETPDLMLEPFTDESRGFSGLVPVGWEELAPANLARKLTALDPTYFVLESTQGSADELFGNLAGQLGLDSEMEPDSQAQVGNFVWDFYRFERRGNMADIALAGDDGKAYFVFLVSTPEEHDALVEILFLPAVEAMAPVSVESE